MSQPTSITPIHGVIFDLDGTLISSNLNFASLKQTLACPLENDLLHFVDALTDATARENAKRFICDHEMQDAQHAIALSGAVELVQFLTQREIPMAVVTRNSKPAAELKMSQNNLPIKMLISREDYPPKPAPDALLAIAEGWQLPTETILYVGDYLYDIQAAKNANMVSCFINHGVATPYQDEAHWIFAELNELEAVLRKSFLASIEIG
jgi:HAD superfamily hydrolase (TIGR01549 family)